ncbi:MAG: hypothetical protein LBP87_05665 [Planctomycetaceae bacterium]|jgi:hypothetical protein|nr:hypothetical protein [Planctomycetaceae bacterium]
MATQKTPTSHNVHIINEREIKDLYQKLGLPTEKNNNNPKNNQQNNNCQNNPFKDDWPPIPEYSLRHSNK